jgi:Troponin
LLLRKKAAEELKKEQERKAAERRRIIEERCGKPKNVEDANEGIYILLRNLFSLSDTPELSLSLHPPPTLNHKLLSLDELSATFHHH